jgi:hypothetical protein
MISSKSAQSGFAARNLLLTLMIHPPLHIAAIPALLRVQSLTLAASRMSMKPWAYEMILEA